MPLLTLRPKDGWPGRSNGGGAPTPTTTATAATTTTTTPATTRQQMIGPVPVLAFPDVHPETVSAPTSPTRKDRFIAQPEPEMTPARNGVGSSGLSVIIDCSPPANENGVVSGGLRPLSESQLDVRDDPSHLAPASRASQLRRRSSQLLDLLTPAESDKRRTSMLARWRSSRVFSSLSKGSGEPACAEPAEPTDEVRLADDTSFDRARSGSVPGESIRGSSSLEQHFQPFATPNRHAGSIAESAMSSPVAPAAPTSTPTTGNKAWLGWRSRKKVSTTTGPAVTTSRTAPTTPRASTSVASGIGDGSSLRLSAERPALGPAAAAWHSRIHSFDRTASPLSRADREKRAGPDFFLGRHNSGRSGRSGQSGRSGMSSPTPAARLPLFRRASLARSNDRRSDETASPAGGIGSGRTSISATTGRTSFSNLFSLGRLRLGSEPVSPYPPEPTPEKPAVLPPRQATETAFQYLDRAETTVKFSQIATTLARHDDDFHRAVLRAFMSKFAFFGEPIDMAVRKLLLHVELPKETQQIDRLLQSFSDRYHECNPGIFASGDVAYFITFSILILQTDVFNKNNKNKMSRPAYIKNSSGQGVSEEVLGCIYDNIVYTPFIRVDDEQEMAATRRQRRRRKLTAAAAEAEPAAGGTRMVESSAPVAPPSRPVKRPSKEPLDPYTLIFAARLDLLRPHLKDVLRMDDPYAYANPNQTVDRKKGARPCRSGILQLESARSRPEAFRSPSTIDNPLDAQPGLVAIPVEKVGILWRKGPKRRAGRSPWVEWGALLTGQGLCLFRNAGWVKQLMGQHQAHAKHRPGDTGPVLFRPAVANFKPDALLSTQDAVVLIDSDYRRHKNAFVFVRPDARHEEVFLADSDNDLNGWLELLNRQAAFKTAAIQLPGREPSADAGPSDLRLAHDVSVLRQRAMRARVAAAEDDLATGIRRLDDLLRHGRHLSVMAPITPKSREGLVAAAAALSGETKWRRFAIWRLKAHRDILARELDRERALCSGLATQLGLESADVTLLEAELSAAEAAAAAALLPVDDVAGVSDDVEVQPTVVSEPEPELQQSPEWEPEFTLEVESEPEAEPEPGLEPDYARSYDAASSHQDVFFTPTGQSPVFGPVYRTDDLSAFDDGHQDEDEDQDEYVSASSGSESIQSHAPPVPTRHHRRPSAAPSHSSASASIRQLRLSQALSEGSANPTGMPVTPGIGPNGAGKAKPSSGSHRSLRSFRPSRDGTGSKPRPQDSSAPTDDDDRLARKHGSFTVHGKKASVITFGAEWVGVSAEERLRARREKAEPVEAS